MADVMRVTQDTPARLLVVGSTLHLTMPGPKGDVHCRTTLLGWKEGDYLISDLPDEEEGLEVVAGMPCMVRYRLSGKMLGYRSEIRGTQLTPEPLLFLSFPPHIEQILLRKYPRVPLNQRVSLVPRQESGEAGSRAPRTAVAGVLQDLGAIGGRVELIEASPALEEGATVMLNFELPGLGQIMNLAGVVKHVHVEEVRFVVGIEFQFHKAEYIEFRGWGGTVKKAIEQFVAQRHVPWSAGEEVWHLQS